MEKSRRFSAERSSGMGGWGRPSENMPASAHFLHAPMTVAPLRFILAAWGLLALNYFLGPSLLPIPSLVSIVFMGLIVAALVGGVWLGNSGSMRTPSATHPLLISALRRFDVISIYIFAICAVGAVIGLRLVMGTGRTLDQAINETGLVRHREYNEAGLKSALANAFGFLSYTWLFISAIYLRHFGGLRNRRNIVRLALSGVGSAAILLLYVVIVSRNAFLVLLVMGGFYVAIIEFGKVKAAVARVGRLGIILVSSVLAVVLAYILFISVSRTAGERENSQFVSTWISLKYKLSPLEALDYELAAGIYKLQWYAAHPIRNLDTVIRGEPPLVAKGGASSILNWPTLQVARFVPSAKSLIERSTIRYYGVTAVLGDDAWQWASGLVAIISDFGMLGSIIVILVWGALIGWTYRDYLTHGSLLSAALCFWVCFFVVVCPLFFPIDNFVQTNLYALLALKSTCLLFGQRNI